MALIMLTPPGRRDGCRRTRGIPRALPQARDQAGKQAGQIADLHACIEHGDLEKRVQQTVAVIAGSYNNNHTNRRDGGHENPNSKKPSKDCPKYEAPNGKDGHETTPFRCSFSRRNICLHYIT